jgi:hypothetical protein
MAPEGNVLTLAWLALPSFMMLPLPKLASISPKTRSRAFFLASLFAAVAASDAGVAAAFAVFAVFALLAGFALAPDALGAFAAAAEEEEKEALCADCARRRDASDPPPFADAEPEEPEGGASSAAARARTPRPAGATARKRRAEDAAGRATRRPCSRVGRCARNGTGRGSSASGEARRRCLREPRG